MTLSLDDAWTIGRQDAHGQAALVRSGDVPPGTLVDAALLRIAAADPALNSVCHRADVAARARLEMVDPAAPMAYVPQLLKASLSYPGFPQTSCSRAKRHVMGGAAHPFAARLDEAGLVAVGMSTMPEFGLLTSGEALLPGPTFNPWNPAYTAGGSSTGAAVAVAAGLVPLAHASDAAGSIRVPAANCGVVGFKPGRGMNLRARSGHIVDDLLCSDALIGRSMRDVAWAARYCRPQERPVRLAPQRLRIALDMEGLDGGPTAEVAALVSSVAELCAGLGHTVETVLVPLDRPALHRAIVTLWSYLGGDVADGMAALHPGADLTKLLEPWTLDLARDRDLREPDELAEVYRAIVRAEAALEHFHEAWDVVLSPVTTTAPPRLGMLAPTRDFDALQRDFFAYVGYTPIQNMAGTPSLSLPMLFDADHLPIGAMFSAAAGGDDVLLTLGAELEAAAPWHDRWPPVGPLALLPPRLAAFQP